MNQVLIWKTYRLGDINQRKICRQRWQQSQYSHISGTAVIPLTVHWHCRGKSLYVAKPTPLIIFIIAPGDQANVDFFLFTRRRRWCPITIRQYQLGSSVPLPHYHVKLERSMKKVKPRYHSSSKEWNEARESRYSEEMNAWDSCQVCVFQWS